MQGLRERMQAGARPRRHPKVRHMVAYAACLLLALLSGLLSYRLYFTESAYIDLDINPSLGLAINCFDRVIGAEAYNADGEALLLGLDYRHKNVDDFIGELIARAAGSGALQREGLVSVSVQPVSGDGAQILERIQADVSEAVSHHGGALVDVFPVDGDTGAAARALHISPAKYLAILELQELEPDVTVDECLDHSVREIRQRIRTHHEQGHHNPSGGDGALDPSATPGVSGSGGPDGGQGSGGPTHHYEWEHGGSGGVVDPSVTVTVTPAVSSTEPPAGGGGAPGGGQISGDPGHHDEREHGDSGSGHRGGHR